MTIELSEKTWLRGMWFYALPDRMGDFMGAMLKEADGVWRIRYRFRYYRDRVAFDSKDEKNWYCIQPEPGQPEPGQPAQLNLTKAFEAFDGAIRKTCEQIGARLDFIEFDCRGDDPKIMAAFAERGYMHSKCVDN